MTEDAIARPEINTIPIAFITCLSVR
jgi:hypothetical protein